MEDIPKQNTGVLIGQRPSDWVAGNIPYVERVPNGDWRPFLVKEEKQFSDNVDTMACVTFSADNSIEIQNKQQTGQEINFADRFIAKLSETTPQGNYLYKVADAIRQYGLVTEDIWPAPDHYTWDSYYALIPQSVIDKAIKYDVSYEFIPTDPDSLKYHLKHAPIQIIITKNSPNHAVVLVAIEGDTGYYFDTYPPYLKTIKLSNIYPSALKLVLNSKSMEFYQVQNESTVVKKEGGKYFELATDPVFYSYIKALLQIPDSLNTIGRDVVNANLGGQLVVGITYVKK